MKKALALLLVLMLALPLAALGETLTAEAPGFGGPVSVTLTVEDGVITEASIAGDSETPTVGGAALEALEAQLVEAGSADIEGVTGATMTSNGVKEAAAAALAQAGGAALEKESSSALASLPSTPGTKRLTASMISRAGSSPPVNTKSPMLTFRSTQ